MTDRLFPTYCPDDALLRRICLVRYYPSAPGDSPFFNVTVMNVELKKPTPPNVIEVPSFYYEHLRRFLWRQQVFMEILQRRHNVPDPVRAMMKKYIMYMDGIVEGLLTTARKRRAVEMYRSRLFHQYLAVEHFVGRHEYDVVGRWRLQNSDVILECQDVESLDWETFYSLQDNNDSTWSGADYQYLCKNVPSRDWKKLADAATNTFFQWHGADKSTRRRKGRRGQKKNVKKAAEITDADEGGSNLVPVEAPNDGVGDNSVAESQRRGSEPAPPTRGSVSGLSHTEDQAMDSEVAIQVTDQPTAGVQDAPVRLPPTRRSAPPSDRPTLPVSASPSDHERTGPSRITRRSGTSPTTATSNVPSREHTPIIGSSIPTSVPPMMPAIPDPAKELRRLQKYSIRRP